MLDPTAAAHVPGKLLVYVGQENVLWGTNSILDGSLQDQIQAFRTFDISPELVATHGYPQLTSQFKAKIFGLNGAGVYGVDISAQRKKTEAYPVGLKKQVYRERSAPTFETFGPKTDLEFEALAAERGGLPA
jgi:hypothetical protein